MDLPQLFVAAIVIVGMVSFIVASGRTQVPPPPRRPLRDHQRQPPQRQPTPAARRNVETTRSSASAETAPLRSIPPQSRIVPTAVPADERRAYGDLLAKAHGDRDLVERLISYEKKRDINGTRLAWIQSAHARWVRDNR